MTYDKIFILVLSVYHLFVRIGKIRNAQKQRNYGLVKIELLFVSIVIFMLVFLFIVLPKL